MAFLPTLIDLVFPPSCLACSRFGYHVCPECLLQIIKRKTLYPLQWREQSDLSDRKTGLLEPLAGMVALWKYRGVFQVVWKEVKYRHYFGAIEPLVATYVQQLEALPPNPFVDFLTTKPILVPTPLHAKRLGWRGFNQATLIAKALAHQWQLPYSEQVIKRHKATVPQAELKKQQRLANIEGSFGATVELAKLGTKPLRDKSILLVDDVWTTGATMRSVGKVIKDLGAEKIWGLVMASG